MDIIFPGTDWTTVFVAFISGSFAFLGASIPVFLHFYGLRRERKSVRAALLAEISALAQLIQLQGYEQEIWNELEQAKQRWAAQTHPDDDVAPLVYVVPVPETYNLIYRENVSRLGSLSPNDAAQVVMFYQVVQSVVVDVSEKGYLGSGTYNAVQVESTIKMLGQAVRIAEALTARRRWWTLCGRRGEVKLTKD